MTNDAEAKPDSTRKESHRLAVLVLAIALALPFSGCLDTGGPTQVADDEPVNPARPDEDPPGDAGARSGGFTDTHVFPGNYSTNGSRSKTLHPGAYQEATYTVHQIESTVDDTVLEVGIVRPEVPEGIEVPVITLASPHFAGAPPSESPDLRGYDRAMRFADTFVPHGYAVALHPIRGADGDGACGLPLGPKVAAELDQLATWLGTRNWSNGNVSFVGLSSDGTSAWLAASTGNPHVETIAPLAGRTDLYTAVFRNGTWNPDTTTYPIAAHAFARTSKAGPANEPGTSAVTGAACDSFAESVAETAHALALGQPGQTGFWAEHSARNGVEERYNGSVFAVHGFQDTAVNARNVHPWIQSLPAHGIPVKQLLGQWAHDVPDEADDPDITPEHIRWDFTEILLHWFDYWLKGDTSRDLGPRVQVEDTQGNWRSADTWPPNEASTEHWYLTPGNVLANTSKSQTGSMLVGPSPTPLEGTLSGSSPPSPSGQAGRSTVRFDSGPLEEDLRFAGTPRVHLTITPLAATGYVTVQLIHEGSNGTVELTGGQASLQTQSGSPGLVEPGSRIDATVMLDPVDAIVPGGDQLVLVVSQSSHEGFEGKPGPVRLEVGDGQSTLTMETFDVEKQTFFDPPSHAP